MSFFNKLFRKSILHNENKIALECDDISYTYKTLDNTIAKLAAQLHLHGVGKGDKVLLLHEHPCKYTLVLLALTYLDAIPLPIYSKIGQTKLEGLIEYCDVNYIIQSNNINSIRFEGTEYFHGKVINIIGDVDITLYQINQARDFALKNVQLILFTSGTTSTPKAIMLTEDNIYTNVAAISQYLKLKQDDNILLIKDLTHSSSIIGELFVGLYNGCKVVMTAQLPITKLILRLMEKQEISIFFAVPTLLKGIITTSKLSQYNLSRLRIVNFYGASMNYKDILKLIEIFPNTNIIYSYGQTEASPRVTYIEKSDLLKKPTSCGKPIQDVSVQIEDEGGNVVSPLVRGEIIVIGPNVMLGYYKNDEKTAQVKRGNRLHTKDLGYLDEDGFLYVTGRADNMFISAGKNIYPEEIEGVIISYDGILEALCLEIKNGNGTSDLIVNVVLKEGAEIDFNKLFNYCKENLELYKIPKEIIVVNELNKTPSGKIIRRE